MVFSRLKVVLYITNHQLLMSVWMGGKYQSHQVYQHHAAGKSAFQQALAQYKKPIVHIVADVAEEAYQIALLPHATGAAKRELVTRKLSQFGQGAEYQTAWFLRQEKAARQQDAYVFLALTKVFSLKDCLAVLKSAQAQVASMTTLSIVSQRKAHALKPIPPHVFISERLSSGLRISYLQNGCLCMSRLVPIDHHQPVQLVGLYLAEIEKMRLYLRSQKVVTDEAAFEVRLSDLEANSQDVALGLEQQGLKCRIVDSQHDISHRNLQQAVVTAQPELLYLGLLASGSQYDNFAPMAVTQHHRVQQLKSWLTLSVLVLSVIGLLVSFHLMYQAVEKREQVDVLRVKMDALLKTNAQIDTVGEVASSELKKVVEVARQVNQLADTPVVLMKAVSASLVREPTIQLNRMRWVQSDQLQLVDEGREIALERGFFNEESGLVQVGFLNAEIQPFSGDYATALATTNQFIKALRTEPNVAAVKLMTAPVNTISLTPLQGNTSGQEQTQAAARFKLQMIVKPAGKQSQ